MKLFGMTTNTSNTLASGAVVFVLTCSLLAPQFASAQSYQPSNIHELIAYFYGRIAQLQLQLDALRQSEGNGNTVGRYRIELNTLLAQNIDEDQAQLRSNIDLDGAAYATGWFEYGEDGDLDDRTTSVRITNRDDDTRSFARTLTRLDEDTRYYYRAVAEGPDGRRVYGSIRSFTTNGDDSDRPNLDDNEPEVETEDADRITSSQAYVYGSVDMNDYDNGDVFFVFGLDEDEVADVEDEARYSAIRARSKELMKFIVERDHDGDRRFYGRLYNLEEDTRYYYTICVEFDDDDSDSLIMCGEVDNFRTNDK